MSFDDGFEVRDVFLDISKAYFLILSNIKFFHEIIAFNLERNDISGKLHSVLSDFLKDRKQRVT